MAAPKTSFYSFLVLPADQRRAIIAVWEFCRAVDDAVDECDAPGALPADVAVAGWRGELARCFAGTPPKTRRGSDCSRSSASSICPPGVRGRHRRGRHGPRSSSLRNLRRSLRVLPSRRLRRRHDLHSHLSLHESGLGRLCDASRACHLQLTNIIRDVKNDLERGRVYLPLEDLRAAGCTVETAAGRVTPLSRTPGVQSAAARNDFTRRRWRLVRTPTNAGWSPLKSCGPCAAKHSRGSSSAITTCFSSRVRVPKPQQALIALRQWLLPA